MNTYIYIYIYSFTNFRTINPFGRDIYYGRSTLSEADKVQNSLLVEIMKFKSKIKPKNVDKKQKKEDILKTLYALFHGRERALDAFKSGIFPMKIEVIRFSDFDHSNLKMLNPKKML